MTAIDSKLAEFNRSTSATFWTADIVGNLSGNSFNQTKIIGAHAARPMSPGLDVWDAWPLAGPAGEPVSWRGGELWFALAVERADDPENRHHLARIHHFHRRLMINSNISAKRYLMNSHPPQDNGLVQRDWRMGWSRCSSPPQDIKAMRHCPIANGFSFAARSWRQTDCSANGPSRSSSYRRTGESIARPMRTMANRARSKPFAIPRIIVAAMVQDYVLFTGSSASNPGSHDGVIGAAVADGDGDSDYCLRFSTRPALITNWKDRTSLSMRHQLYLFWSTQRGVFAPGIVAPTGLYGASAKSLDGPWKFLNGHGLVVANPVEKPDAGV